MPGTWSDIEGSVTVSVRTWSGKEGIRTDSVRTWSHIESIMTVSVRSANPPLHTPLHPLFKMSTNCGNKYYTQYEGYCTDDGMSIAIHNLDSC